MSSNKFSGSCLCGQVKFEITGNFDSFFLCHCKHCQKDTGSAHAANLFATKARFTWLSGQSEVRTYNLPQTRHTKSFCPKCGSALPTFIGDGTTVMVPAGSLDTPISMRPDAHLFDMSRANWDEDLNDILKFDTLPNN